MFRKKPSVSVVIAAYQHAMFVEKAVASVLEQSFSDLEVIVVDDGSTDGTADLVAAIDDDRIKLIRLTENRLENPRNVALAECRGKYIAFQNSDDEWLPEKLASQLQVLDQDAEIGAVFTEVDVIDADGNLDHEHNLNNKFKQRNRSSTEWLNEFFFNGNCLCITSAIMRKSILDKTGWFRPSLVQISDLDLWIRVAALAEINILNTPLTRMRVIGESNLSLKPVNRYRLIHELAQVFEHYGEPLLLKRLAKIFPAISRNIPGDDPEPMLCFAALARYASNLDSTPHRLFADRAFSRLLDNSEHLKSITNTFWGGIHKKLSCKA